jgi:hypothetical protein
MAAVAVPNPPRHVRVLDINPKVSPVMYQSDEPQEFFKIGSLVGGLRILSPCFRVQRGRQRPWFVTVAAADGRVRMVRAAEVVRAVLGPAITTRRNQHRELFGLWDATVRNCYFPWSSQFYLFGARGITVCPEWVRSFDAFAEWALANGYEKGLRLVRPDESKPFSPENCRFVR